MEFTPTRSSPVAKPILLHIFLAMLLASFRNLGACLHPMLVILGLGNQMPTTAMHVRFQNISEQLTPMGFRVLVAFTRLLEFLPRSVLIVCFSRPLSHTGQLGISWSLRCPWPSTSRGSYALAGSTRRRISGGMPASSPGPSRWPSSRSYTGWGSSGSRRAPSHLMSSVIRSTCGRTPRGTG